MNYFALSFEIIFISLTGVMLPGAMTAVTLTKGVKSPFSGLFISFGHGIVEVPLIFLVFFGFSFLINISIFKIIIAFAGSLFLLATSISMFIKINDIKADNKSACKSSVMLGILFSIGNPAFIIWWITIGANLILKVSKFGILFFIFFIILHWLCDLIWLFFLSFLSFKGGQFFGNRFQRILFFACGIFLLFFSAKYAMDGVKYF